MRIVNTIENGLSTIIQNSDNDNILDNIDNCINIYNPEQNDYDFDDIGIINGKNHIFINGNVNDILTMKITFQMINLTF